MKLAWAGIVLGLVAAVALMQVLSSFLFGITPTDPATYLTLGLVLTSVALVACYIPARRAARIDPVGFSSVRVIAVGVQE